MNPEIHFPKDCLFVFRGYSLRPAETTESTPFLKIFIFAPYKMKKARGCGLFCYKKIWEPQFQA